jgi:Phosphoesterase family
VKGESHETPRYALPPAVSWVTTTVALSDHPPSSICTGENWSVQQIDAVMNSPNWSSTAIALTWMTKGCCHSFPVGVIAELCPVMEDGEDTENCPIPL